MMATNLVGSPDRVKDTVRFSAKNQEEAGKNKYNFGAFMDQMDSQKVTLPEYNMKTGDTGSGAVKIVQNDYSNSAIETRNTMDLKNNLNIRNKIFGRKRNKNPFGTQNNGVHQIQSRLPIQKDIQRGNTTARTQTIDEDGQIINQNQVATHENNHQTSRNKRVVALLEQNAALERAMALALSESDDENEIYKTNISVASQAPA